MNKHYDAIVIGARVAGSATALGLARGGAKVLLVDRAPFIGDTLSTHALMRPAARLLQAWGLLERATKDAALVDATTFNYAGESVRIPIKPTPGLPGLYAPRRLVLDRVMCDAAIEAGAELALGLSCADLLHRPDGRVAGVVLRDRDGRTRTVRSDLVVGADGRASTVAELAGAETRVHSTKAASTIYTYVGGLENRGYQWYYGVGAAAGLFPTGDGLHCLFTSCRPAEFRQRLGVGGFQDLTRLFGTWEPELAAKIAEAGPVEKMRRYPGAPGHIRQATGPGWALVGDAGFFKDPATAHGISDAFLDADRLSRAWLSGTGSLFPYECARDRHALSIFRTTQEIAALDCNMDRLKALHMELSHCMKAEAMELEDILAPKALAA